MQQRTPNHRRLVLSSVLVGALVVTACGESDSDSAPSGPEPTSTAATPEDRVDDGAATPSGSDLSSATACLTEGGYTLAAGDEASTGLSADMMTNLGITQILVFDDGAGSAGTIESYTSPDLAELAASGYADSPLGYEVGRADDVVYKTVGSSAVLDQISGCLAGTATDASTAENGVGGDEETSAADEETATGDVEDAAEAPGTADGESATDLGEITMDLDPARAEILGLLISPRLEEQGVILDPVCMNEWVLGFSDADAELLAASSGDTEDPAVSAEGLAQAERVFGCLDLDRLAALYAADSGLDEQCVRDGYATVDLDAVVAEGGADIDVVFRALATAIEGCN